MARKIPTPEQLAELAPDQLAELSPEVIKQLGAAHYRGLGDEQILALFPPSHIGPSWLTDDDGDWLLPEHTLGWEIAGWTARWLLAEDGTPWRFTMEQLRVVLWWYAVDEDGEFTYRRGVLQRLKGWGKDPLLAVLCLVEAVGPSRFSHWDAEGNPVGKAHPAAWVQVAAVSRDQTRNTMTLFPSLMSPAFREEYAVDPGIELIRLRNGRARIEAVTSSPRSLEGGRTTFVVLNETHHWVSGNQGHLMYDTIHGNATKTNSRYLAITNAYLPGEDSVAQRMREVWNKIAEGRAVDTGFFYDSLEAHAATPLDVSVLPAVLRAVRGDAVWLNIRAIVAAIQDATISPSRSRRMWLNQIVAEEDALYGPDLWDALEDDTAELMPGDEIVLGFDGGKTDDATALVAIRVTDRIAFPLHVWEKPDGPAGDGWEIDRVEVSSAVAEAFHLHTVHGFYADVALWESYIAEWERDYGADLSVRAEAHRPIGWDMRRSQKANTLAHERLMRAIFDGKLRHDGDPTLRRHALNARRAVNNYGISFRKGSRESPRKVDAYAALFLAFECLTDYESRPDRTKRSRTGRGFFL